MKKRIPKEEDSIFSSFKELVEWTGKLDMKYLDDIEYQVAIDEMTSWADYGWEEDVTRELKDFMKKMIDAINEGWGDSKSFDFYRITDIYIEERIKEGTKIYWWLYAVYDGFDWDTLEYKGLPRPRNDYTDFLKSRKSKSKKS